MSSCKEYLNSGRYLWRHNGIVNYIISLIDKKAFKVYSDLPGYTTPAGGSIPADLLVTPLKPDLVIIDIKNMTVEVAELTCPWETRIEVAHKLKTEKYSHFVTDINQDFKTTLTCFEVGSRGLVSRENRDRIRRLHKYTDKSVKLKKFIQNISYISILSSYYIYIARNEPSWTDPPFISPPNQ